MAGASFQVRIPTSLREQIDRIGAANDRSRNYVIVQLLTYAAAQYAAGSEIPQLPHRP